MAAETGKDLGSEIERLDRFLKEHFAEAILPRENTVDTAIKLLCSIKNIKQHGHRFAASILYNRGLGNELINLPEFEAQTPLEAKNKAEREADTMLGEGNWKEVKVRPIL